MTREQLRGTGSARSALMPRRRIDGTSGHRSRRSGPVCETPHGTPTPSDRDSALHASVRPASSPKADDAGGDEHKQEGIHQRRVSAVARSDRAIAWMSSTSLSA